MKRNLLLLATALVALSCTESAIDESAIVKSESSKVSINVAMPTDQSATRIAISEDTESGDWITSWVDTDCLGGWSSETCTFTKFEMVGTTDGTTATFEGLVSANDLRLVYPYDDTEERVVLYCVDIARQDVVIGSFDHMSAYTYMASDSYIEDVATEGTAWTMKHVGAAIELALRFEGIPDGAEAEITRVAVRSEGLFSSAGFNLYCNFGDGDDVFYFADEASYTLNVDDNSVENYDGSDATTYSIPFNIFPFSVDAESSITFDVYVSYTVDDVVTKLVKSVESVNTTDQPITFDRATISHINKIVDMSDAEEDIYAIDGECIENGDFEAGESACVIAGNNAIGELITEDGNSYYKIGNDAIWENWWDAQIHFRIPDLRDDLVAGETYILSFKVKSDNGSTVVGGQYQSTFGGYLGNSTVMSFNTTTEWTEVTMEQVVVSGTRAITFNIGGVVDNFYFDDCSLKLSENGNGDVVPDTDDDVYAWELIENGDFEDGESACVNTTWSYATGALSAEGEGYGDTGYAYVVSNSAVQTNGYDAQFAFHLSSTDALAVGDTLRISFNVRSENGSSLTGMHFGCNESPWYLCSVGGDTVATSSEWSTVSFDVVLDETSVAVEKFVACIGSTVDTFYIDNCSVKHIPAN